MPKIDINATRLTGIQALLLALGAGKLDIDEINLELLLGLDTDQERRTTAGSNNLIGVVGGLEDEGERTLEFRKDGLDEFRERCAVSRLRVVDILCEDGYCLSVGLTLEMVSTLLEQETECGGVSDNTVVHDGELGLGIRLERMAVHDGGRTVCCPAGVCNRHLREESLAGVDVGLGDALAEAGDLAYLLEEEHLARLVAIDTNTCGIIATVLLPCKTIAENLTDSFTILKKVLGACLNEG